MRTRLLLFLLGAAAGAAAAALFVTLASRERRPGWQPIGDGGYYLDEYYTWRGEDPGWPR